MQHILDDKEYQDYLTKSRQAEELSRELADIKSNALDWLKRCHTNHWIITPEETMKRAKDPNYHYSWYAYAGCEQEDSPAEAYCDCCAVGWLLDECPLGRDKEYSK
jgi:hypothetical protein